jgi:hypothetical protein
MNEGIRARFSHTGRIMETELGEKKLGEDICEKCTERNEECWMYTIEGAQQISRPGSVCARCRVSFRECSVSTYPNRRASPPHPRPLPPLLPRVPSASLPPGGST